MNSPENVESFRFTSLPKVISPRGHAIIDYLLLATTLSTACLFGRKNRVIGTSAFLAALLEGANVVLCDFPGGIFRLISFPAHGRIGLGNLPVFAALPALMGFAKRRESAFFYVHVLAGLAVISMTDFGTHKPDATH